MKSIRIRTDQFDKWLEALARAEEITREYDSEPETSRELERLRSWIFSVHGWANLDTVEIVPDFEK